MTLHKRYLSLYSALQSGRFVRFLLFCCRELFLNGFNLLLNQKTVHLRRVGLFLQRGAYFTHVAQLELTGFDLLLQKIQFHLMGHHLLVFYHVGLLLET